MNGRSIQRFARILTCFVLAAAFMFAVAAAGNTYAAGAVVLSETNAKLQENCTVAYDGDKVTVTDTDDNNDVWNSKLLLDVGIDLTAGEQYKLSFSLTGENGVGEFFLCKSENIDDRYDETFTAEAGNRSITFTAEGARIFIGMQVGNLGKGHSVTLQVQDLCELSKSDCPALLRTENGDVTAENGVIAATDTDDNNDVWNSKLLYDAGIDLEVGKTYQLSFSLAGDNGVGEFFVCKSRNLNDRYDSTFTNAAGERTVTFKAEGEKLYIGMQFGNLGKGNAVIAKIGEVKEAAPAQPAYVPAQTPQEDEQVIVAENCTYEVESTADETVIEVTDTGENDTDVWNSKFLYYLGEILEKGKCYAASFNLAGENGVGEFFFCKTDDLNNRYSFDNTPGDHVAKFAAEGEDLYAGLQFGNVGEGNEVTVTIGEIVRILAAQVNSTNCTEVVTEDTLTLTDTDDNGDVWNSKAVYNTGIILEPGKTYTATVTLSGANVGVEFFFLKSNNPEDRYTSDWQAGAGDHTYTFTADNTALFFFIQCGNLGNGNSVTISNISVTPVEETGNRMMMAAAPQENEDEAAPEEGLAPAEEEAPAEEPVTQAPAENEEVETPAEEPAAEEIETPAEEPAEEETPAEEPAQEADGE